MCAARRTVRSAVVPVVALLLALHWASCSASDARVASQATGPYTEPTERPRPRGVFTIDASVLAASARQTYASSAVQAPGSMPAFAPSSLLCPASAHSQPQLSWCAQQNPFLTVLQWPVSALFSAQGYTCDGGADDPYATCGLPTVTVTAQFGECVTACSVARRAGPVSPLSAGVASRVRV